MLVRIEPFLIFRIQGFLAVDILHVVQYCSEFFAIETKATDTLVLREHNEQKYAKEFHVKNGL